MDSKSLNTRLAELRKSHVAAKAQHDQAETVMDRMQAQMTVLEGAIIECRYWLGELAKAEAKVEPELPLHGPDAKVVPMNGTAG